MRRLILFTFMLFMLSASSFGQEILIDLQSYPVKKSEVKKSKSLTKAKSSLPLPFFDDFSRGFSTPDPNNWTNSYVLVNQNYSINPPTIGVATFDAINQYGKLYSHLTTISLPADTLTSQPINLGPPDNNNLYLSFQYEPQGLGKAPETTDSLMIQFLSVDENKWIKVWSASAHITDNFLIETYHLENRIETRKAASIANVFFKVMLPIDDERFQKEGFQFRFINYASFPPNTQVPSLRGNGDQWHIDLVYLKNDRDITDTITNDVAFSQPIKSFLKNYESIPWKHFNSQARQEELTDPLTFNIQFRNLTPIAYSITKYYVITDLSNLSPPDTLTGGTDKILPFETVDFPDYYEHTYASNWNDSAKFGMESYLEVEASTTTPYFHWNDTVRYTQKFFNYYAYDDGTAENGYGLFGEGSQGGKIALKYHSYESDSLKGILIYFNQIVDGIAGEKQFDLTIWKDISGKPGDELYRKTVNKPSITFNTDTLYKIDEKLKVGGDFWIGTINRSEDMLNVGFDKNNIHNDKLYYNISGTWIQSAFEGSLMMKPVFGKFALGQTGIVTPVKPAEFTIYPNPASNQISINLLEEDQPERIRIVNLAGQVILNMPYTNSYIDVSNLQTGIYLFQLTHHNRTTTTKKLVIIK